LAQWKPQGIWLDGKVRPWDQATIHVLSPTVKYGVAVFEGIRAYWNPERGRMLVFRLEEHSRRLVQSARMMRMENPYAPEDISRAVLETLRELDPRCDVHIRALLMVSGDGPMTARGPVSLAIAALERGRPPGFEQGIRCQISSWRRISDEVMPPRIKCTANYHNGRLAALEAKANGYDQALLLNSRGELAEAPGACVFLVRAGQLITPPVTDDILESITRETVLILWQEWQGRSGAVRPVDRTELYVADEVFLCGTAAEITPVIQVDDLEVGDGVPGPITRKLQSLYLAAVRGEDSRHHSWCTEV